MVGWVNTPGSGGVDIQKNKPVIHVNAPVGSTVDFTLNSVIIKSIPSEKSFPNVDGKTAEYYYTAKANGTYTVTASLNADAASSTVIVNGIGQYDVALHIYPAGAIYWLGDEILTITGGWVGGSSNSAYTAKGTFTKDADSMFVKDVDNGTYSAVTNNQISLINYNTLYFECYKVTGATQSCTLRINSTLPSSSWSLSTTFSNDSISSDPNNPSVKSANIASLTSSYRIALGGLKTTGIYFTKVWLE